MMVWLVAPLGLSPPVERPSGSAAAFADLLLAGLAASHEGGAAEGRFRLSLPSASIGGLSYRHGSVPADEALPAPSAERPGEELLPSTPGGDEGFSALFPPSPGGPSVEAQPFQRLVAAALRSALFAAKEGENRGRPENGEEVEREAGKTLLPLVFAAPVSGEGAPGAAGDDAFPLAAPGEPAEEKANPEGGAAHRSRASGAAPIQARAVEMAAAEGGGFPAAKPGEPDGLRAAMALRPAKGAPPHPAASPEGASEAATAGEKASPIEAARDASRGHPFENAAAARHREADSGQLEARGVPPERGASERSGEAMGLEAEAAGLRREEGRQAPAVRGEGARAHPGLQEVSASVSLGRADSADAAVPYGGARGERAQRALERPGLLGDRASPPIEPGEGKLRAEPRAGFAAPEAAPSFSAAPSLPGARALSPAWSPLVAGVAHALRAAVTAGREEAVIQLEPPELGKLRIEIAVEKNRVEARLLPDSPEVAGLLESRLGELRLSLQSQNLETLGITVELAGRGGTEPRTGGGSEPRERSGGRGRLAEARGSRASAQRASGGGVSVWA